MSWDCAKSIAEWWTPPLMIGVLALTALIFATDTLTDFEVAAAVFYGMPILLSAQKLSRREVRTLTFACSGLIIVSSLLTTDGMWQAGLVNMAISTVAILETIYMALRLLDAEAALGEARAAIRVARVSNLGELASSIAHEVN